MAEIVGEVTQKLFATPVHGLDQQRFFVLSQRNHEMGYLIPTEVDNSGHVFTFQYSTTNHDLQCLMKCSCGWSSVIESFQNSWSVIEVKVTANKHLNDFGIYANQSIAIFDFKDFFEP